jgi:hypothetical protein
MNLFESPELLLVGIGALAIGVCATVIVMEVFGLRGKTIVRLVEKAEGETPPVELLHVELDPQTNKPSVRLRGQRMKTLEAIDDPQLRSQIRSLLHTLAPTSMLPPTASDEATTTTPLATNETAAATPPPSTIETNPTTPTPPDPLSGSFLERLRDSLQKPEYVTGPTIPLPTFRSAKPASEKKSDAPTDMFASINTILQRKLRGHPELPPVEILSGVDSLQIKIEGQIYRSIADVPDATVQQLIRAAIDEWDR